MTDKQERLKKQFRATKRITLPQIRKIVKEYLPDFPSWRKLGKDGIYRARGPFVQAVIFERLSFGVYRPLAFLHSMLRQFDEWGAQFHVPILHASGAGYSLSLSEHYDVEDRYRPKMLEALRRQLRPSPEVPLELVSVYNSCVQLSNHLDLRGLCSGPTPNEAIALAAIAAYLDREREAAEWIATYQQQVKCFHRDKDWEKADAEYIEQLERWMRDGVARENLDKVVQSVKHAHGIEDTE